MMKNKNYRVSRATLYNTIELLLESGLVRKHQFGSNQSQYEKSYFDHQHDHIILTDTGEVKEFCDPRIQSIKKNIEDETGNVTRFLIMGKDVKQSEYEKNKKYITTCIFRLKSEPSALYKSLGGFAANQINLTKLESFSVKNTFDQTNFYLDLEGHIEQKGVQKSLEELRFHTESLNILGVYEASKFRHK